MKIDIDNFFVESGVLLIKYQITLRILQEVLEANKLPGAICSLVQGDVDVGYGF